MAERETYYQKMKFVNDFRLNNCTARRYKRLHIEDVSDGIITFMREHEHTESVIKIKLVDFIMCYEVSDYCVTNLSKLAPALKALENKHKKAEEKAKRETVNVKVTMTLNVARDGLDHIRDLRFKTDSFINSDAYPEIKSIEDVKVQVL